MKLSSPAVPLTSVAPPLTHEPPDPRAAASAHAERAGDARLAAAAQRALSQGTSGLDTAELLALVIGRPGQRAADSSSAGGLLARGELAELARASAAELLERGELRRLQAARLAAAFELGRRAAREARPVRPVLRTPRHVHELLRAELAPAECESFLVLLLDGRHRLRRLERISEGSTNTVAVHPRDVYRAAVRESASAIIAVHNHPSGDPDPSPEDLEITRRILRAGQLIGIPLLDHVVIAAQGFVSLRERMSFDIAG